MPMPKLHKRKHERPERKPRRKNVVGVIARAVPAAGRLAGGKATVRMAGR